MHRKPAIDLLTRYGALRDDACEEAPQWARVLALLDAEPRCFFRDCFPGHLTASAWIISWDEKKALLTHHRKLGRWLQLGGHADGDPDLAATALREAREESGMHAFDFVKRGDEVLPLDVDVHRIPARGDEPAHDHHDVRFLLRAHPDQTLVKSDESNDLRWFDAAEFEAVNCDESVQRLARKTRLWLAEAPPR